jgi:hypothetical protein
LDAGGDCRSFAAPQTTSTNCMTRWASAHAVLCAFQPERWHSPSRIEPPISAHCSLPAPSAVRAAGSQSAPLRARFVYWTFRARPCPFFLAILSYSTEECTVCRRPPGWAQDAAS